jgi:hypothetical protein
MWFLPFSVNSNGNKVHIFGYERWFLKFVQRLLQGDERTIKLLKSNPFPSGKPKHLRAQYYLYKFTSAAERQKSGDWWKRTLVGQYLPPLSLSSFEKASEPSLSNA